MNEFESPEQAIEVVAKSGGTSMANPPLAAKMMEGEGVVPHVAVLSAAGVEDDFPIKTTVMLRGDEDGEVAVDEVFQRYRAILRKSNMEGDPDSERVVNGIPEDIRTWQKNGWPVEALGENWSTRLYAAQTGRRFIDATELFFFKGNGELNRRATSKAIRNKLTTPVDKGYAVPGYYGSKGKHGIGVFDIGGTDISAAIIVADLGANFYHNWSDVDGFMSADPRNVENSKLIERLTYREVLELYIGGSQLLHGAVANYLYPPAKFSSNEFLLGSEAMTVMRNTFGDEGNMGTEISWMRNWLRDPVVSVAGRSDMLAFTSQQAGKGSREEVETVMQALGKAGIPAIYADGDEGQGRVCVEERYRSEFSEVVGNSESLEPTGLAYVVGEGLRKQEVRDRVLGELAIALDDSRLESGTSEPSTLPLRAAVPLLFPPKETLAAVRRIHSALLEEAA